MKKVIHIIYPNTHEVTQLCEWSSYPLSHSLNPVLELVDHVTHLQGFAATVCVEVLLVGHDAVEVRQRISPGCQELQDHLSQLLSLQEQSKTLTNVNK